MHFIHCISLTVLACFFASSSWAADRCKFAPEALGIASKLRNLKAVSPVECASLDRSRFRQLVSTLIQKDLAMDKLEEDGIILSSLGLIPESYDYKNCIVDALAVNAAAFYSPNIGFFVVPDWVDTPLVILVHESVHALQDQHFNLKRFGTKKFLFDDQNTAHGALLEGDAMVVEEAFLSSQPSSTPSDPDSAGQLALQNPSCALPKPLALMFDAMYQDGVDYVKDLKNAGGFSAINAALRHPPTTTKEILRYGKVQMAPPAKQKNEKIEGSIGQIGLRSLLTQVMTFPQAQAISVQLEDDRFSLSGDTKSYSFRSSFKFTSRKFSDEALSAFRKYFTTQGFQQVKDRVFIRYRSKNKEISISSGLNTINLSSKPLVGFFDPN